MHGKDDERELDSLVFTRLDDTLQILMDDNLIVWHSRQRSIYSVSLDGPTVTWVWRSLTIFTIQRGVFQPTSLGTPSFGHSFFWGYEERGILSRYPPPSFGFYPRLSPCYFFLFLFPYTLPYLGKKRPANQLRISSQHSTSRVCKAPSKDNPSLQ